MVSAMQTQACLDDLGPEASFQNAEHPIRVVIVYDEIAAGKRALQVMSNLGREPGEVVAFHPLPWSFGLLADTNWRVMAAADAVRADILIIATASPHPQPLPPAVGQWTEAAISSKQGMPAAVIALFGPEDDLDASDSSRLDAIKHAARRAGLAFFAPTPRRGNGQASARNSSHARGPAEVPGSSPVAEPAAGKGMAQAGTNSPETFRDRFCQAQRCRPAEFTNRVFLLSLHVHALPVAMLLWPWRRRFFAADHAMIDKVGSAQWRGDVQWKPDQMRTQAWLGGPGRRLLRCRISTRRLATLMNKVMRSSAAS